MSKVWTAGGTRSGSGLAGAPTLRSWRRSLALSGNVRPVPAFWVRKRADQVDSPVSE